MHVGTARARERDDSRYAPDVTSPIHYVKIHFFFVLSHQTFRSCREVIVFEFLFASCSNEEGLCMCVHTREHTLAAVTSHIFSSQRVCSHEVSLTIALSVFCSMGFLARWANEPDSHRVDRCSQHSRSARQRLRQLSLENRRPRFYDFCCLF
jgi:hypothetical protein